MRVAIAVVVAAALLGCGKRETSPSPSASPPPSPSPSPPTSPSPTPSAKPAAPTPALRERPGGPSMALCEKAASHLGDLVMDSALGPTEEQRRYIERMEGANREQTVRYCLEIAAPREIECVAAAKDISGVMGCDRFRREVPAELVAHREPTQADCERFFDRLRGFRIEEGAAPDELDRDRDQVVRACQEKAKIGTLACFIASPTYAQARACP